jgi:hypothetical protein
MEIDLFFDDKSEQNKCTDSDVTRKRCFLAENTGALFDTIFEFVVFVVCVCFVVCV